MNGLHSCKPGNEPAVGQVKTFVVIHNPATENKKAWTKIKSALADQGGTPYRITSVKPTGFTDSYGNIGFSIDIEPQSASATAPRPMPAHQPVNEADGINETRQHIMRAANLHVLCVNAVNAVIAPNVPAIAQTPEFFQAAVASLFIEASGRRSTDGVTWWSYTDKMPTKPVKNGEPTAPHRPVDIDEQFSDADPHHSDGTPRDAWGN